MGKFFRDMDYQFLFFARPPRASGLAFNPLDWLRYNRTSTHASHDHPGAAKQVREEDLHKDRSSRDIEYQLLFFARPPKISGLAFNPLDWLRHNRTTTHTAQPHGHDGEVRHVRDHVSDDVSTESIERFRPWLWPYYLFVDSTRLGFLPPPRSESVNKVIETVEQTVEEHVIRPVEDAFYLHFLNRPVLYEGQTPQEFVSKLSQYCFRYYIRILLTPRGFVSILSQYASNISFEILLTPRGLL
jgi:hypothetical protein